MLSKLFCFFEFLSCIDFFCYETLQDRSLAYRERQLAHSLVIRFVKDYIIAWCYIVSTPPPKLRGGFHNFRIGDRGGIGLRHLKGGVDRFSLNFIEI